MISRRNFLLSTTALAAVAVAAAMGSELLTRGDNPSADTSVSFPATKHIDGYRILFSSGNIESGKIWIYG